MASVEDINTLLQKLEIAPPSESFANIDKSTMGIKAVLRYLNELGREATAGEISQTINVSTARMAVLLKKMVLRNLIEKRVDANDGRIVRIILTKHGQETANYIKQEIYKSIGELIDKIGMAKMLEFAEISCEIHALFKNHQSIIL